MEKSGRYIPALRFDWLTPFYDSFLRRMMKEDTFKSRLIEQAQIQEGHRVLDLGCGTGTLAILIKQRYPTAEVIGLDADPRVLAMAEAKAEQAGVHIVWQRGMAYALPHEDSSFDRVLSTLVMHHLDTTEKRETLKEVCRVLKPGGELHIADFGPPHSHAMSVVAALLRHVEEIEDNFAGRLPAMMAEAGFIGVAEVGHFATIFGPMSLYRAATPEARPRPGSHRARRRARFSSTRAPMADRVLRS